MIYQIFPRSFRDSNGDRIGDLRGIASELNYIRRLGATAILINPIVKSRMYHNYFSDDFFSVDPAYGTARDLQELCRQAHRRGIKVLLDMEDQYVTDRHPWYGRSDLTWPDHSIYTSGPLALYDGEKISAQAVDPLSPKVLSETKRAFRRWVRLGVDGFRIDHMMDDFDAQGAKVGMLARFWRPIIDDVRSINPRAYFMGEQSDWGYGDALFASGVDAVFGLPLAGAIRSRDFAKVRENLERTPSRRLVLIENHDMTRFASLVSGDPLWERFGAVLNLTLPGTPILYYGQELGMRGEQGKWGTDGNDIPVRLAMRWSPTLNARGTATWYRNTGPWWSLQYSWDHDGISVEEQERKPASLLSLYRALATLRRFTPALTGGVLRVVTATHNVLAYYREAPGKPRVLVVLNATDEPVDVPLLARAHILHGMARITAGHAVTPGKAFAIVEVR